MLRFYNHLNLYWAVDDEGMFFLLFDVINSKVYSDDVEIRRVLVNFFLSTDIWPPDIEILGDHFFEAYSHFMVGNIAHAEKLNKKSFIYRFNYLWSRYIKKK